MTQDDKPPATTYEFFLGLADRFGVPCLILAAVLWMIRDAAIALHSSVILPVVQSHTRFLETTQHTLEEMGKTQDKQAETLQAIAEGQRDIHAALTKTPTKNPAQN